MLSSSMRSLEEVSRLKGIETNLKRCGDRPMIVGLEEVSRLKGIETVYSIKGCQTVGAVWKKFPV